MFNRDEEWSLLIVSDFLHYYNSKIFIQQQRWFQEKFYSISKTKAL